MAAPHNLARYYLSTAYKGSSKIVWDAPAGNIDAYNVRAVLPGQDVLTVGPQAEINITAVDPDEPATEVDASVLFATNVAGDYEVYVRAKDNFGDWGPYSDALPVTLVLGPEAPGNLGVL